MPTYHYRCSSCEQHLEVVQSMTDDPITECALCGGQMHKVLQPVGIVLKGTGFYRTDSRSKSGSRSGDGDGSTDKAGKGDKAGKDTAKRDTAKKDTGSKDSGTTKESPSKASASSASAKSA